MKVYCSECKYLGVSFGEVCSCEHKDNIEWKDLHEWYRRGGKETKMYIANPNQRNRHNGCAWYIKG
ncbi:hypothetical protein LCGC14_3043880 [marine sediment metagenome]|uniref:Uncharacterized protein n=1 Tax=marine sediment metagenome TaxID=412755 RepID=A0A0F8ZEQ3_9ZZZZ